MSNTETFIVPSDANAIALIARGLDTPIVMLNLLRFRDQADYGHAPDLAPDTPISGAAAYEIYRAGIEPLLTDSGGKVLFDGAGGHWFIGPEGEGWDHVLLVQQASIGAFLNFAGNAKAQELGLHRTAALADSRLLPLTP